MPSPHQHSIDAIRLVPELRAVHLDRHPRTTPAKNLYFRAKYDLLEERPDTAERVTTARAVRHLLTTCASTVELPEPLWIRFYPTWIVLAAASRLGGLLHRRHRGPRRTVVHAMELTPFPVLLGGRHHLPRPVVAGARALVSLSVSTLVDRICFASRASQDLYESLPMARRVTRRTMLELPESCPGAEHTDARPLSAVHVGLLAPRGGVHQLLRAWEEIERAHPSAHLTVVGGGPLLPEVRRWADRAPTSRTATGPLPRPEVLDVVARNGVLVAPSVPEGRWREQIGLPIKEGLSTGATVVTTRQTGLSGWLEEHGHHVVDLVDDDLIVDDLVTALSSALTRPLDRCGVRRSLPAVDGRIASDAWLHSRADAPHA